MLSLEDQKCVGLTSSSPGPSAISKSLHAIRDGIMHGQPVWDITECGSEGPAYRLAIASNQTTRERAYRLAHRIYERRGYASPNGLCVSPFDAQPGTLTLLIEDDRGQSVATVSLIFDSPMGLPCDEIYSEELNELRAQGRRLVEVTRLAMTDSAARSKMVLVRLFNFIYIFARRVRAFTDFVIEVNPRHVDYYRRQLLFEMSGPVRPCPRVNGAPAALLQVDLSTPDRKGVREDPRMLYRLFYSWLEEGAVAEFLACQHKPMTTREARYFNIVQPLVSRTSETAAARNASGSPLRLQPSRS